MPEKQFIIPLAGIKTEYVNEASQGILIYGTLDDLCGKSQVCPKCEESSHLRIKAYVIRTLRHGFWNSKRVDLRLKVPKLLCKKCLRYFMARVPGVLPKKRATEEFRKDVFHRHQAGMTQKHLSRTHAVSGSTVERWTWDFIGYRIKELSGRPCPRVMGFDEHFFTRKKGYATTLVDLKNHKVFDVRLGRSEASLKHYLSHLQSKDKVQVAVMDLSETYRSIVKKHFPQALIVADRFHVIRLINHHFLKAWQSIDERGRKNRGLLSLMRRHEWNLKDHQVVKLSQYFEKYGVLKIIYEFKNKLVKFLLQKSLNKLALKNKIPEFLEMIEQLLQTPITHLRQLGETLQSWQTEILRMLRFRKTNSITEGLHNKMEMISRRAFGFRNFENYRLRVIALCGWDGLFKIRN